MKNTIIFGAMLLAAAGCAKQEEIAAPAPEVVEAAPTETAANAPDAYYEYLWCKQGEEFSQEKMAEFTAGWNTVIDGMDAPALAAFGYIPKGWETFVFQLVIASFRPRFGRRIEKYFHRRVGEYDGTHITPVGHQTGGFAKLPLQRKYRIAYWR